MVVLPFPQAREKESNSFYKVVARERGGLVPPSRERRKEAVVGEGEGNREGRKEGWVGEETPIPCTLNCLPRRKKSGWWWRR